MSTTAHGYHCAPTPTPTTFKETARSETSLAELPSGGVVGSVANPPFGGVAPFRDSALPRPTSPHLLPLLPPPNSHLLYPTLYSNLLHLTPNSNLLNKTLSHLLPLLPPPTPHLLYSTLYSNILHPTPNSNLLNNQLPPTPPNKLLPLPCPTSHSTDYYPHVPTYSLPIPTLSDLCTTPHPDPSTQHLTPTQYPTPHLPHPTPHLPHHKPCIHSPHPNPTSPPVEGITPTDKIGLSFSRFIFMNLFAIMYNPFPQNSTPLPPPPPICSRGGLEYNWRVGVNLISG